MPRNKNAKTFLIKKQKKLIAARLMQISLKVDEYVYKQVPISVKSAEMFIKEVAGYEDKCFDDRRALQVIEKLIRCMKGIIAEQEELHPGCSEETNDVTFVDVDTILASSIYDDLTQFTQEIVVDKFSKPPVNNIELIDLRDVRSDIKERETYNEKEAIEFCDDERYKDKVNKEDMRKMKGIIAEQEELHRGCSTETNVFDVDTTLAFSIDDDLTQFTQEIDVDKILKPPENNIELFLVRDVRSHIKEHANLYEKKTVHFRDEERDKNKINKEDRHTNENLERAISNLSIRCEDDPLSNANFNPEDCSQSILNNFDCSNNVDNVKWDNTNKIVLGQDFETVIQSATITKDSRIDRSVSNGLQTRIRKTQGRSKLPKVSKIATIASDLILTAPSGQNNCLKTNKNDIKEKAPRKRGRKATSKLNKDNEEHNKQTHVKKRKQTTAKKNKQNKVEVKQNGIVTKGPERKHTSIEKFIRSEVANITTVSDLNKKWNANSNSYASVEILSNQKNIFIKNAAYNPTYNKDVENDLSWTENIRYVREITQEEYIPAYYGDDFWENYTFPEDWNNDDFLYT